MAAELVGQASVARKKTALIAAIPEGKLATSAFSGTDKARLRASHVGFVQRPY
jgi:hypothetical protein